MNISIAMATYNGAKYLQEQLDSLKSQSLRPYELVVCDDGSSDETLGLVQGFADTAPFRVRIFENETNLGFADNFLKAARLCEGEWVAFCDQDDVWLPNKLSDCASEIEHCPDIVMVLQNSELCDGSLTPRGKAFPDKLRAGVYGPHCQYGFWVWLGCLQTVSSSVFQDLNGDCRPPNYFPGHSVQSHDKWTCMVANALGGISVVKRPAALYRRHEQALTGSYDGKGVAERIRQATDVGVSHYRFLSEVASSSAEYMHAAAQQVSRPDWQPLLSANAVRFSQLSAIQAQRADLYGHGGVVDRLRAYVGIWFKGGYVVGPRFTRMGLLSALKDGVRVLRGPVSGGRR
jgi:hypothetical protein